MFMIGTSVKQISQTHSSSYKPFACPTCRPDFGMTTNIKKSTQHGKLLFSFAGAWYGLQDAFAAVVRPFLAQMVSPTLGKFHVWHVCLDFIAWTGSSFFLAYSYSYLGENHGLDYQLAKPNWKSSAFDFR
jgi:hypothetical protein